MAELPSPAPAPIPPVDLTPCNRKGCARFATQALALSVPFVGKSTLQARPLLLYIGLVLCKEHMRQAKAAEFMSAEFKRGVGHASIEAGRGALAFDRAITVPVQLDDPAYLGYLAMAARVKGQQQ